MDKLISHLLSMTLRGLADKIDTGACKITEEKGLELLRLVSSEMISKEQACDYLGISRATFDNYVASGKIPKGTKQKGFKELFWDKADLVMFLYGNR